MSETAITTSARAALCDLFDAWTRPGPDDAEVARCLERVWRSDPMAEMGRGDEYQRDFKGVRQSLRLRMHVPERLVTYCVEVQRVGGENITARLELIHDPPPLMPGDLMRMLELPRKPPPPVVHRPAALTGAGLSEEHEAAERRCAECWGGWPKPCECGGLVHAEFEDESWHADGDVSVHLRYACDRCGPDYVEAG